MSRVHDVQASGGSAHASSVLSATAYQLVCDAYYALQHNTDARDDNNGVDDKGSRGGDGALVSLATMERVYNCFEHPRVREGVMAPSAATATLRTQFAACAHAHGNRVRLDEFVTYHEKLACELAVEVAADEDENDDDVGGDGDAVDALVCDTIRRLWRLGDELLQPTGIRPAFAVSQMPAALYAATPMTLLWRERDAQTGAVVLKGIRDVVRPIFARGDLPRALQGHFAFPCELTGMHVQYVPTQIAIQRWLDFVWRTDVQSDRRNEKDDGVMTTRAAAAATTSGTVPSYGGVPGIIAARVDLDTLPPYMREHIVERAEAQRRGCAFVRTAQLAHPCYTRSSQAYGEDVVPACARVQRLKDTTAAGTCYGQRYHGIRKGVFSRDCGPTVSNAATGINL